jgi:hypothetical protein
VMTLSAASHADKIIEEIRLLKMRQRSDTISDQAWSVSTNHTAQRRIPVCTAASCLEHSSIVPPVFVDDDCIKSQENQLRKQHNSCVEHGGFIGNRDCDMDIVHSQVEKWRCVSVNHDTCERSTQIL